MEARRASAELEKGNSFSDEAARLAEKLLDIDEELNRRADDSAA